MPIILVKGWVTGRVYGRRERSHLVDTECGHSFPPDDEPIIHFLTDGSGDRGCIDQGRETQPIQKNAAALGCLAPGISRLMNERDCKGVNGLRMPINVFRPNVLVELRALSLPPEANSALSEDYQLTRLSIGERSPRNHVAPVISAHLRLKTTVGAVLA
jgi:hypothetical protein